ncbi:hypothetical protein BH10BAC2_BH10BAC2_44450 [soil metagenome]
MKYFFCVCSIILLLSSCAGSEKKPDEATYTEQKESLEVTEKKHPLKFLSVTGDDKKNLIGQTVVRGTIYNKATVVAYKDVRVKMLCYKNGKMVEEHEDVIDEVIKPGTEKDFKTKYRLPKGTDSIYLSVMSASADIK